MPNLSNSIADAVGATAVGAAFFQVAPLRWARQRGMLRDVFEFNVMKGAAYSARWGFDFPICPIVRGKRLVSKVTLAKATPDLVLDPIDVQGDLQPWHSVSEFDQSSGNALDAMVSGVTAKALAELDPVGGLSDLVSLFQARSGMAFKRFAPKNYIQTYLCWGLVCHSLKDRAAGETHIASFCEQFDFSPDTPALVRARKAATALSETVQ